MPGTVSISEALLSLVSAVFAERIDPGSPQNSQRLVLLARVQAYISSHLGDPELTVTEVAEAHHQLPANVGPYQHKRGAGGLTQAVRSCGTAGPC